MATRNASNLCKNQVKAEYRAWVLKAFNIWLGSLFKFTRTSNGANCKVDSATVYSLPATIWEFEQFLAGESLLMTRLGGGEVNLHCFESDWPTYAAQKNSRSFMLNDKTLYRNFNFNYSHDEIPVNAHAKSNFGAWYDFCGNPTQKLLDIAIAPQNFKHNSLVFVTFDCNVQAGIQVLPVEIQNFIITRMEKQGGIIADHITDAVVHYINENTGNKVRCIMHVEYQAQRHPMMLLGFTNSRQVLEDCGEVKNRISREKKSNTVATKRTLNEREKKQLRSDLKSFKFTRHELMEKYNCNSKQVGAQLTWVDRYGDIGGYADDTMHDLIVKCAKGI